MGPDGTPEVFVTHPSTNLAFYPKTADDWCGGSYGTGCYTIDLSPWANQPDIKLMFEAYNRYGNNLFLNDIEVNAPVGQTENTPGRQMISIFPNPSHGKFNLTITHSQREVEMMVMDPQGQVVYTETLVPGSGIISKQLDFSRFARGIYFVKLTGERETDVEKIVIQ